ncbi:neuraminidase [Massarina eburnea CBS 473.64]|uniref:Neuraminidase n=1 Tax=Massarina eburnea CBS 473.64 TaxID=1395130 RepID=A0A6A6RVQ7_9PLEO|nr:neuraminidase [Massarina eburnea CBS 473.64]
MRYLNILTTLAGLLAAVTAATVKLDGKPITVGDGGYPRAIVLKDNTLVASYARGNSILVRHSKDEGITWSEEYVVRNQANPTGKVVDLNNAFLYQKPSGEVLCAYRRHIKDTKDNLLELNIDVSHSTDGGKVWNYISSVNHDVPRDGVIGFWEPFLRYNIDGKLEVYWAHEISATNQDTVKKVSEDEGKSWGPFTPGMTGVDKNVRDGMPNFASLDSTNKNLIMAFETNEVGPFKVWTVTSSNGGKSWGDRKIIFSPETPTAGRQAGGPGIVNMNGTLVVSFMTNQDAEVGDGYPHAKPGTDMKVITSTDKGNTWSAPVTVIEDAAWGGITVVDDRALVLGAAYTTGKAAAQFITVA